MPQTKVVAALKGLILAAAENAFFFIPKFLLNDSYIQTAFSGGTLQH